MNSRETTREFIAKTVADTGKGIVTVGFASYFFERLEFYLRIGFFTLGWLLLALGILIHAAKRGDVK